MDPIRTTRYARATGFNPGNAPNTAAQQKRQDDEFIRQFKETKELEIQQEAERLARLKENNQIEQQNLAKNFSREEEYAQQQDRIKLNQLQREYQAQRSVTGMTAGDKKFNDALNLITSLSQTAVGIATKVGAQMQQESVNQATADFYKDQALGFQGPNAIEQATENLGAQAQDVAMQTIQQQQLSDATQIERSGGVDLGAKLKGQNSWYKNTYLKLYAGEMGKDFGKANLLALQQEQVETPDKEYVIDGELVPVSQIDLSDSEQLDKALSARIPEVLKSNGLDEYSTTLLNDFYKNSAQSIQQTVGTIRDAQIETETADRVDTAKSIFRLDATPLNSKMVYNTLTQSGVSNAAAREGMWKAWEGTSDQEFEALGNMPFGPNGLSFKEQYPGEYQRAVAARQAFQQARREAARFEIESGDEEALLDFRATRLKDMEDGTFDADPATLAAAADAMEERGNVKTAKAMRDSIKLTASKLYDSRFIESMKKDMDIGIVNFNSEQIENNKTLSGQAKQEALQLLKQHNETAVPADLKQEATSIMNQALKNRLGTNTFTDGPAHFSLKIKQAEAFRKYQSVYKQELQRSEGNSDQAHTAAMQDFYAEFNNEKGAYQVTDVKSGESARFTEIDVSGKEYTPSISLSEVNKKIELEGERQAFSKPELYKGESEQLQSMLDSSKTGKLVVPETIRRIQDNMGGTMSMRQLLNQRLKANDMDELPKEVGTVLDEVERSFDRSYDKFLNYKPNPTRTDIATIGSGGDAIYGGGTPAQEEIKSIFGARESPNAGYDAINAGKGGDRPGGATRHLGRPLTSMTLGEVKRYQRLPVGDPQGIFAVGKYQFIPDTLEEAAAAAGITDDMPFNEAVQDRIFFVHLDRYGAHQPWEQWWIQQGGQGLALSAQEKAKIEAFRESYDPSKPWRQARNMRPELTGVR